MTVRQAAAGLPCLPVTGGLISLYRGELTTTDVYGGNNGDTPPTILFPQSPRGNSFFFNGSTAVTIPRRVAADFTLETWIKTNNPGAANETDWTQGAGIIANDQFGLSLGNGKIMFGVAGTTITSTATVNDDNWHHIVATRVAATGTLALYIDGVEVPATANGPTGTLDAGASLLFGRLGPTGTFYTGELDEIKIYNQTLSAAQATLAFNGCTTAARASVGDAAAPEGDPNPTGETTSMNFTVTLTQPAPTDVYINYQTVDGTAREGVDYIGAFGRLTIPAGQTSGIISVGLMPDDGDEDDLTFTLVLDRIAGADLADDEAVGVILDDDDSCEITLDEDEASIGANGGTLTIEVDDAFGCGWTAASTVSWITVTDGQSGDDNGTVVLSVGANTGGARSGDVAIGGNVFRVDQSAPLAPTVTLGGYVFTGEGKSVRNARVILSGPAGTRVVRTNSFGRYRFTDVPTGQTVTIAVESKGLAFASRTVAVTVDNSGIDLGTAPN